MRGFVGPVVVAALIVTGCGNGGAAPITEPSASSSPTSVVGTGTITEPVATTGSEAPGLPTTDPATSAVPTTSRVPAAHETAVLSGEGIGPFDFGAAVADVDAWAAEQFGTPDYRVELRPPLPRSFGPPSDADLSGDDMLWISWANGLELAFSDRGEFRDDDSLHLAWWSYRPTVDRSTDSAPIDGVYLTTVDGFGIPSTTDEFSAVYPIATPSSLVCEWYTYDFFEVPLSAAIGSGLRALHSTSPSSGQDTVTGLSAGAPWRCPPAHDDAPIQSKPGEQMTTLQLDGSGLNAIPFGTAIDEVRARLEPLLGPPNIVFTDSTVLPEHNARRGCYLAEHESTEMTWTSPRLTLWFHDGPADASDGVVRLGYWWHGLGDGTPVIATPAGARPGITVGALLPLEPTLRLGPPGDCGCHRVLFEEAGAMEINTDWNSTLDVQRFLADHGYPIEITGEIDEPTRIALNDYLVDLDEGFYCGCADFRTLDALGITVPAADAIVTSMSAGTAGRCDCGC